ncbi:MAG: GNAT family N-acetyltransferase [Chloroflexota bacterium]
MRAVLAEAAMAFRGVPGVEVLDEGDLVRSFAPGLPQPYLNTIARLDVPAAAFPDRVVAVEAPYRKARVPTSWWLDDTSRPADAAATLAALGVPEAGGEAVMALDLEPMPEAVRVAEVAAAAAGIEVAAVHRIEDLEAWIGAVAGAYGWVDAARAALMRTLYDPRTPHGADPRRIQVVARIGGTAVGAASLFAAAGQGWVTNVGTIPAARGRGVGAALTAACLRISEARGEPSAWLAASAMGEPVYARLGFRTVGRVTHHAGGGALRP